MMSSSSSSVSSPPSRPPSLPPSRKRSPPEDSSREPSPAPRKVKLSFGSAPAVATPVNKPVAKTCNRCSKHWEAVFFVPNGPNAKAGTTTCLQCRIRENVLGADVLEGKDVSLEGLQRLCADKLNQWRTNIQRFGMELTEEMEDKAQEIANTLAVRKATEYARGDVPHSSSHNKLLADPGDDSIRLSRRARPSGSYNERDLSEERKAKLSSSASALFDRPSLGLHASHMKAPRDFDPNGFLKGLEEAASRSMRESAPNGYGPHNERGKAGGGFTPINKESSPDEMLLAIADIANGYRRAQQSLSPELFQKLKAQLAPHLANSKSVLAKSDNLIKALNRAATEAGFL